jgi:lipopolysaccharide export system permease protein
MVILNRYLAKNIAVAIAFVLFGFVALFAFFDFINELGDVGRGSYKAQHAFAFVLLAVPAHIYEIMPVACLIGTIYALAQLAANSEFTAMRAAGLGRYEALMAVLRLGLAFSLLTVIVGEALAPPAEKLGQKLRLSAMGASSVGQFRSGVWLKDTLTTDGSVRRRFVNVSQVKPEGELTGIKIFEFDDNFRMTEIIEAETARYLGAKRWLLSKGKTTELQASAPGNSLLLDAGEKRFETFNWLSDLSPDIFTVLLIDPSRMSAMSLFEYVRHLQENKQKANLYEIAMWKKLIYPLAAVVMMFLALPFAYLQVRSGSIGVKVFTGIMVGIAFHFVNGLFSHLGLLNTWPPFVTVVTPPAIALFLAAGMLAWVDRT